MEEQNNSASRTQYKPRPRRSYNSNGQGQEQGQGQRPQGRFNSRGPRPSYNGRPNTGRPNGGNGRPNGGRKPNGFRPRPVLTEHEIRAKKLKQARRERLEKTYTILHFTFPKAFDWDHVIPLQRDVHAVLFEHFKSDEQPSDSPVKKAALRQFLTKYIRSEAYHNAVISLKKRYDLQGVACEDMSDEEVSYHQTNLEQSKAANRSKPSNFSRPRNNGVRNFNNKGNFNSRGNNYNGQNRGRFNQDRRQGGYKPRNNSTFFKEGDIVFAGEREGVVKAIVKDKVSVLLENKLTLLLPFSQVRKINK